MRHHTAVLVDLGERGKGWHYASVSRRGGGPIGNCRDHPPHPTEAEARACYQQYERDQIRLDGQAGNWMGCQAQVDGQVCDKPTKNLAEIRYSIRSAALCDEHLTHDRAVTALGLDGEQAGDSWLS